MDELPTNIPTTKLIIRPLIVVVLVLGIFLGYVSYQLDLAKAKTKNEDVSIVKKLPVQYKNKEDCKVDKEYMNDTALNIIGKQEITDPVELATIRAIKDSTLKHLGDLGGEVVAFDVSLSAGKMIYAVDANSVISVYLHDLKTNTKEKIHVEKTVSADEMGDYFLGIKDVGISQDGTLAVITTATGAYRYNVDVGVTSELFSVAPKDPNKMGIYAYRYPRFSENNKYLLLTEGHYEGSSSKVFDLEIGRFLDIAYSGYVAGSMVEGWYGNKMVIQKYGEYDWVGDTGFYLVDPENPTIEEPVLLRKTNGLSTALMGDYLYFTDSTSEPSGLYSCNNVGTKYGVASTHGFLKRVNLQTNVIETLFEWDSTEASGVTSPSYKLLYFGPQLVDGRETLVVSFVNGEEDKLYSVSDTAPFELTEITLL